MTSAYLFDFDETLAHTDQWKPLRRRLLSADGYDFTTPGWRDYFERIVDAEPVDAFEGPYVADTADDLIRSGAPVAIVTTSPRQAPISWFQARYGYAPKVVVGFEDTRHHKPYPQPIEHALARLSVHASRDVLSIGDHWRDVVAAHRAKVTSATFDIESGFSWAPDLWIEQTPDGYVERLATQFEGSGNRFVVSDGNWFVGGRYHADGGRVHDLIWESKSGNWAGWLVDAATYVVAAAASHMTNPVLTSIPPHDGDDRFAVLRMIVANRLGIESAPLLKWQRPVGSLHAQRLGPSARKARLSGALIAERIDGVQAVILDDVLTTGATMREATRAIVQAGATARVAALTATLTSSPNVDLDSDEAHTFSTCPSGFHIPNSDAERERETRTARQNLWTEGVATSERLAREAEERRVAAAARRQAAIEAQRRRKAEAEQRRLRADQRRKEEQERRRIRQEEARQAAFAEAEVLRQRKRERLEERAREAAAAVHAAAEVERRVKATIAVLPRLRAGVRPPKTGHYQTASGVALRGVTVPVSLAAADAALWVRAGRPDDISAFKRVVPKARFALLRFLQAADV